MFSKQKTNKSTNNYFDDMKCLADWIQEADAIVIGAGSGLSAADGHLYSGKRFTDNFADFIAKYHFSDMYTAGFFPFETLEDYWAYWSRHVYINRYLDEDHPVYTNLLQLVADKNYFVLTTNVDHCFQKSGFDQERLFYTQGDYGRWQCSTPCHQKTYDNEQVIKRMVAEQKNLSIPSELVPYCPKCGRPMAMHLRCDASFVEDENWHIAAGRYTAFLRSHAEKNVLYLEIGVGGNTPGIIKYPFWQLVHEQKNTRYVCINQGEAMAPQEIASRSLCINADIKNVLAHMNARTE